MIRYDAAVVLGKELRHDPERALRELRARAAAAAAVHRATGAAVVTLEARLRGQDATGSAIVRALLDELGVPADAVVHEDRTRSTREEIVRAAALARALGWGRVLLITARYHIPRVRRLVADEGAGVAVHGPAAALRIARPLERRWIADGEPDARVMRRECATEAVLSTLARAVGPLPFRAALEIRAGGLLRRAPGP